ncbi:hypothetical protein BJY14_003168 [Actinomadura luteofluorescens]|uniref:Uncharacterized protein n=2 Tax=Actinomadura luteofluorescens TaxID=46163 RepID=A0A7Y9JFQ4_9ACTN|nr:hypothetical protein [Actinomadura luteofluorescens]NYD47185.1 hypothetical protein [Actinomadura luteofluorescens]
MTKFMIVRSAAFIRSAVIGAVLVIAGAVITGICAAVMSNGDQNGILGFKGLVALAICAAAGAGILVAVSGIINLADGVGFTWPTALAAVEVLVTMGLNLVVGGVVGAVCGSAFFDRILVGDLFFNTYVGGLFGFGCACTMAMGGLAAWSRINR